MNKQPTQEDFETAWKAVHKVILSLSFFDDCRRGSLWGTLSIGDDDKLRFLLPGCLGRGTVGDIFDVCDVFNHNGISGTISAVECAVASTHSDAVCYQGAWGSTYIEAIWNLWRSRNVLPVEMLSSVYSSNPNLSFLQRLRFKITDDGETHFVTFLPTGDGHNTWVSAREDCEPWNPEGEGRDQARIILDQWDRVIELLSDVPFSDTSRLHAHVSHELMAAGWIRGKQTQSIDKNRVPYRRWVFMCKWGKGVPDPSQAKMHEDYAQENPNDRRRDGSPFGYKTFQNARVTGEREGWSTTEF